MYANSYLTTQVLRHNCRLSCPRHLFRPGPRRLRVPDRAGWLASFPVVGRQTADAPAAVIQLGSPHVAGHRESTVASMALAARLRMPPIRAIAGCFFTKCRTGFSVSHLRCFLTLVASEGQSIPTYLIHPRTLCLCL